MASPIISLFHDPPPSKRRPSAFLVSSVVHVGVLALLVLGLHRIPHIDSRTVARRYAVRILNLQQPEPKLRAYARNEGGAGGTAHPGSHARPSAASLAGSQGAPAAPRLPLNVQSKLQVSQTLVQPDVPPDLLLKQNTPIPQVVMWSPGQTIVRKIVAPPPQVPASTHLLPTLDTPNQEPNPANLKISSSAFTTALPSLPPSTTSPLNVQGPVPAKQILETASKDTGKITPARVISNSDIALREGPVALPLVNQVAPAPPGSTASGQAKDAFEVNGSGVGGKQSAGEKAGDQGNSVASLNAVKAGGPAGQSGNGESRPGTGTGAGAGAGKGAASGLGAGPGDNGYGAGPGMARITSPKTGQFGVVIVGGSLAEQYPETSGLWGDRLAYTVYVHVGLAKSWILQYSLPRQARPAIAGGAIRPDAPWPYDILRPSIDAAADADAILVHGFVNVTGHFEKLAIVFPPQFADATFLLQSLQQWQFRPAKWNGETTAVEVLLIIPNDEP